MTLWLSIIGAVAALVGWLGLRAHLADRRARKAETDAKVATVEGKLAVGAARETELERRIAEIAPIELRAKEEERDARKRQEAAEDRIAERARRWPTK